MIYLDELGNAYRNLGAVPVEYYIQRNYSPDNIVPFTVLSDREYKKALKLDRENPTDPRSLSSIINRLNERRKNP